MGINGLHAVVRPYLQNVSVDKYRGRRVGVDAFAWLHRGAVQSGADICTGNTWWEAENKPPPWVSFCLSMVYMLQGNGIHPVVVFDGDALPAKAAERTERRARKAENIRKGQQMLAEGNTIGAQSVFSGTVDVTPEMAHELAEYLRREHVEFLTAPFEADSQLAFLSTLDEAQGGVAAVVTEDSDLIAYGCARVLFKCSKHGDAQELELARLLAGPPANPAASKGPAPLSFAGFSAVMLQTMCILCGCDFLPSVKGVGTKTAHVLVRRNGADISRILRALKINKKMRIPDGYAEGARRAQLAFACALVFEPHSGAPTAIRPLQPLPPDISAAQAESVLGAAVPAHLVMPISRSRIHPSPPHAPFPVVRLAPTAGTSRLQSSSRNANASGRGTPSIAGWCRDARTSVPSSREGAGSSGTATGSSGRPPPERKPFAGVQAILRQPVPAWMQQRPSGQQQQQQQQQQHRSLPAGGRSGSARAVSRGLLSPAASLPGTLQHLLAKHQPESSRPASSAASSLEPGASCCVGVAEGQGGGRAHEEEEEEEDWDRDDTGAGLGPWLESWPIIVPAGESPPPETNPLHPPPGRAAAARPPTLLDEARVSGAGDDTCTEGVTGQADSDCGSPRHQSDALPGEAGADEPQSAAPANGGATATPEPPPEEACNRSGHLGPRSLGGESEAGCGGSPPGHGTTDSGGGAESGDDPGSPPEEPGSSGALAADLESSPPSLPSSGTPPAAARPPGGGEGGSVAPDIVPPTPATAEPPTTAVPSPGPSERDVAEAPFDGGAVDASGGDCLEEGPGHRGRVQRPPPAVELQNGFIDLLNEESLDAVGTMDGGARGAEEGRGEMESPPLLSQGLGTSSTPPLSLASSTRGVSSSAPPATRAAERRQNAITNFFPKFSADASRPIGETAASGSKMGVLQFLVINSTPKPSRAPVRKKARNTR